MAGANLQRAGLVATNSIRGAPTAGARCHLRTRASFDAWSDEPWVNDGAAVRVSLVAFGSARTSPHCLVDGHAGSPLI